ncbi:hypothetical protein HHK36_022606 [Tetracentron sinense]|uniref:DNA/RNA-binding protein Alba-like domain-containing protein n=1 Tax=Tetracentron sinense TaxID=13715 RepID=A0A834YN76_TETSI|nr:hypothetical protein HHK36_022606 [Tetracentron sinense]
MAVLCLPSFLDLFRNGFCPYRAVTGVSPGVPSWTEGPPEMPELGQNVGVPLRDSGNITATIELGSTESHKKNRIQVSSTKKPMFFYVNLAKKYLLQYSEIELSALGLAISTVVTISEILKNNGLAIEKKISTSTVGMKDEMKGRLVPKAKIEIVLEKTESFNKLMIPAATAAPDQVAADDDNNGAPFL